MALYKAQQDCIVFGRFRRVNEEFEGPEWGDEYAWEMPTHIALLSGKGEATAPGSATEDVAAVAAPRRPGRKPAVKP